MLRFLAVTVCLVVAGVIGQICWEALPATIDYPGRAEVLHDKFFWLTLFGMPLVISVALVWLLVSLLLLRLEQEVREPRATDALFSLVPFLLIVGVGPLLVVCAGVHSAPPPIQNLKQTFLAHRDDFDEFLVTAQPSAQTRSMSTPYQIGPYKIDAIRSDGRGGVYFRTASYMDFIDQVSFGFAYRPAGRSSPFGSTNLTLTHLTGAWYLFSVSDDA